jgi:hypothetical protein
MGRRLVVALVTLAVAFGAGCASSRSGNAALSPDELADRTLTAFEQATSFHVAATGGSGLSFDLRLGAGGSHGTITQSGTQLQFVSTRFVMYLKAPAAFYAKLVAPAARARVLPQLTGKWLRVPVNTTGFEGLATFASKQDFVDNLLNHSFDTVQSGYGYGPDKTINGVAAVSFTGQKTTVYVPKRGTPYPIRVAEGSESSLSFDEWNRPVTVSLPPAGQAVDVSILHGVTHA